MLLHQLDFDFPPELIAQHPIRPRDACRLLVLDPCERRTEHRVFRDLSALLRPGDVLVLNDSRVLHSRLVTRKVTGGRVELLFLHKMNGSAGRAGDTVEGNHNRPMAAVCGGQGDLDTWEALARPSHRLKPGTHLRLPGGEEVVLVDRLGEGRWVVGSDPSLPVLDLLATHGEPPLPPYIRAPLGDSDDYQTVYAAAAGSAAAPTAGLHFTPSLIDTLTAAGIENVRVTLHVGLDTFRPITEEQIEDHRIHSEAYQVGEEAAAAMVRARKEGRRLVAVGTTSVRIVETLFADAPDSKRGAGQLSAPLSGYTSVYITPGHRFRAVDALITNFHLPRTSLLALVMAFAGEQAVREAYRAAIEERYRLFSFGDAMLITSLAPESGRDHLASSPASLSR